jgi:hypothetical protein
MRVVLASLLLIWGSLAVADEPEILAEGVDEEVPDVELHIPEAQKAPLMQSYHTELGQQAVVVTPRAGEPYAIIPEDKQNDFVQQENQPTTESQWRLLSW